MGGAAKAAGFRGRIPALSSFRLRVGARNVANYRPNRGMLEKSLPHLAAALAIHSLGSAAFSANLTETVWLGGLI
jgi:hypothetical protein